MSKVEQQIDCPTCPWNKNCIEPPTMTKEEVDAKVKEARPTPEMSGEQKEGVILSGMLSVMFFGGKDTESQVCPIFANVLRDSPELSQKIKALMQKV